MNKINFITGEGFKVITFPDGEKHLKVKDCYIFINKGCAKILDKVGIYHNKMKITAFGRSLSDKINGKGGPWAKFKEIGTYVGCSNVVYDSIIDDKCVLNGIQDEIFKYRTALMMAFANNKLSN